MTPDEKTDPSAVDVRNPIQIDQYFLNTSTEDIFDFLPEEEAISPSHELPLELQDTNIADNFECEFQLGIPPPIRSIGLGLIH
jgi:hypothetical protein